MLIDQCTCSCVQWQSVVTSASIIDIYLFRAIAVWQDKIDDLIYDKDQSVQTKDQQFEEGKEQVIYTLYRLSFVCIRYI